MSGLRRFVHRVIALVTRSRQDREFDEERAAHLALAAADYERKGLSPEAARRAARLAFGGYDAAAEVQRDARGLPTIESLIRDLSHAVRGLRREPGLAAVAILILAMGIGANTAVFSLVRPVLLRPLPFDDARSLVWITNTGTTGMSGVTFRTAVYEALATETRSFTDWTAYFAFFGFGNNTLTGIGDPERVVMVDVAPRFFELLGVHPAAGRLFTPAETAPKGQRVVLISHRSWQRRFVANPAIVGTHITINDRPTYVAGVLPASFDFASVFAPGTRVDLFKPADLEGMRPWGNTLSVIGRLSNGSTIDDARAEMDVLIPALMAARPDLGRFGTRLTPLQDHVSGSMRRPLLVLWGAVGLVLLIVCANISNLLLARSSTRTKEFAVRLALGAGRRRIFQQLALEGIVLASIGAALGIPLAFALTSLLKSNVSLAIPLLHQATVDGMALLVTAAIALATGVTFSILPSWRLSRANPHAALLDQSRGSTASRTHAWVRSALVVTEVAMASVLLIGAGLLLRSFVHLLDADIGFRPAESTVLSLRLGGTGTNEARLARLVDAVRHVREVPGVDAAGLTDALPLDRNRSWGVSVPGEIYPDKRTPTAFTYVIGPGYFDAMGMSLRAGRDLASTDSSTSAPVVVISESLARVLYPDRDPIGLPARISSDRPHTIVGVVADVRQSSLDEASASQMYLSQTQGGGVGTDLVVRSSAPLESLVPAIRRALAELDSTLLVTDVRPLSDLVERSVSPRRFLVSLLSAFSMFALLLASLGIYGVVSYGVSQRVQEIGVRMALGATAGDVRRHVLGGTLRLAVTGIVLGLAASLALGQVIGSLLFETSPTDTGTFAWTALLLLSVACVAGYLPAMRASSISPMRALQR